jgi:hypothetical protein
LEYFVEDLLTVLNLPEWPAAEILLSILSNSLASNLASADPGHTSVLKVLSVDLLGAILTRVKQEINNSAETPFSFPLPKVNLTFCFPLQFDSTLKRMEALEVKKKTLRAFAAIHLETESS